MKKQTEFFGRVFPFGFFKTLEQARDRLIKLVSTGNFLLNGVDIRELYHTRDNEEKTSEYLLYDLKGDREKLQKLLLESLKTSFSDCCGYMNWTYVKEGSRSGALEDALEIYTDVHSSDDKYSAVLYVKVFRLFDPKPVIVIHPSTKY